MKNYEEIKIKSLSNIKKICEENMTEIKEKDIQEVEAEIKVIVIAEKVTIRMEM